MVATVLQLTLSGVATGCVYGLVAIGFVLIYKATETVNFAQGELMMLGAFLGYTLVVLAGLPWWLGLVMSLMLMALLGAAMETVLLRPVLGQSALTVVMVTIGFGFVARGVTSMIPAWGDETHRLPTPFADQTVSLGGVALSIEQGAVIVLTALLCGVLYVFFRFTRIGVAMQAISQNQLAAYYMGIPVRRINTFIWALSAGVAAFAGILLAPVTFVHPNMGLIGLKAFPAAVVGGFDSLPGAIIGGMIIGLVESYAGFFLPEGFKDVAAYAVVLLMLMLRPHGLFGGQLRKKV